MFTNKIDGSTNRWGGRSDRKVWRDELVGIGEFVQKKNGTWK